MTIKPDTERGPLARAQTKRNRRARPGGELSLRARAIFYLSRREFSAHELATKLQPFAQAGESIAALLVELQQSGWLSNERFAHGLAHKAQGAYGVRKLDQMMQGHQLDSTLQKELLAKHSQGDYERACALYVRKFGASAESCGPEDDVNQAQMLEVEGGAQRTSPRAIAYLAQQKARMKRMQFLAARGFSAEVVARVLRAAEKGAL